MNIMEGNFFDTFISRHFDLYSQDIYGRRGSGVDQYFGDIRDCPLKRTIQDSQVSSEGKEDLVCLFSRRHVGLPK